MKMRVTSRGEDKKLHDNNNLKKQPLQFMEMEKEFFKNAEEKHLSPNLTNYVFKQLIYTQRGYGFNKAHTLSYSIILLQELNLSYKFPPIFWQAANLIVDSGSYNEVENDSTNYDKTAVAIANIISQGVNIELPDINDSDFGFKVDVENSSIRFGLKGINGVNTDIANTIIEMRPYASFEDVITKLYDSKIIKASQMIKLIKSGCFNCFGTKEDIMHQFIRDCIFSPIANLTLSQFNNCVELGVIPEELILAQQTVFFKKYVLKDSNCVHKVIIEGKKVPKKGYHDRIFVLDQNSQRFFKQHFDETCVTGVKGEHYTVSEKLFIKETDKLIQPLKDWFTKEEALKSYNDKVFTKVYTERVKTPEGHWSVETVNFYDGEHELAHVNSKNYGVVDFNALPEEPEPYDFYTRYINGEPKAVPKYKINRIFGTIIATDKNHRIVSLLTPTGLVNVKLNKGHYAFYSKRISADNPETGKSEILENSWLTRGNLLLVAGIRRGDIFQPLIYKDTIYNHTLSLITEIKPNGELITQSERIKV